jgi:hypothetical protein
MAQRSPLAKLAAAGGCFVLKKYGFSRGIIYNTSMKPKIVIDTNIVISALKSSRGASNKLLSIIGDDKYDSYLSVPLIFEYEDGFADAFH